MEILSFRAFGSNDFSFSLIVLGGLKSHGDGRRTKMTEHKINIMPSWETIVKMVCDGSLPAHADGTRENLLILARIGDLVTKAQQEGKSITFTPEGKEMVVSMGE